MKRVAIVTGASSGIGLAVSEMLQEHGWTVYGISRRGTGAEDVQQLAADVRDEASVAAAVDEVVKREGRIDLLVNNAGMGISGPVEFTKTEDAKRIMDINFMGQFICARTVLPYMRSQGSGRIVCTSSVAAPIAIPYQAFYSASKAAVNAMALALRNEVKSFGIQVCAVMPGDASTGFTAAREKNSSGDSVYAQNRSAVAAMERDEQNGMSPKDVARVIVKAGETKSPGPLYVAGTKYKLFNALFKFLPARISYWIVGKMYS